MQFALVAASLIAATHANLVLSSSRLSVTVDELFPRPLAYALASTNQSFDGALQGYGFHPGLSVNAGQITCGEAALATTYIYMGAASRNFVVDAACVLNWWPEGENAKPRAPPALTVVLLQLNGTVAVLNDPVVPDAGIFRFSLASVVASLAATGQPLAVFSLDIAGMELLSFKPVPTNSSCMHVPDENDGRPACGGDAYYVDAWAEVDLDEWAAPMWSYPNTPLVTGIVDINTPAGSSPTCLDGGRTTAPYKSILAGGWSHSAQTGAAAISSQRHLPFATGPRAFDAPGRCSRFTIAHGTIFTNFSCGSPLPFELTVGLFPDLTKDGIVDSDDIHFWRRAQFPRPDPVYRTKLAYKVFLDGNAYVPATGTVVLFADVQGYMVAADTIFDGQPQVPILVGWQGMGHDTLYPALDEVNTALGGAAGLEALASFVERHLPGSSLSYHVNTDEAYSKFNGSANTAFQLGAMRLNVDHVTPWCMHDAVVKTQVPDYGLRCSFSKTKDAAFYGRYSRIARFFDTVPGRVETIHSDAWRDVGASYEKDGFIPMESEQFCGQMGDAAFWAGHGVSLGIEGQDGQAAEFMGIVSFWLHDNGASWSPALWGRIIGGSSLGFDSDTNCLGGKPCAHEWFTFANQFYTQARLYQMALTDELLGVTGEDVHSIMRFGQGGLIRRCHVPVLRDTACALGGGPASTWPLGGDNVPVATDTGGFLTAPVTASAVLANNTLHAYQTKLAEPLPPLTVVNQTWTMPLSWVGRVINATEISPFGARPIRIEILDARNFTIVDMTPGYPVRLVAQ